MFGFNSLVSLDLVLIWCVYKKNQINFGFGCYHLKMNAGIMALSFVILNQTKGTPVSYGHISSVCNKLLFMLLLYCF